MTPQEVLKTYWGYDDFRPLQADIIQSVLDGKDTLALMPTGGGKSLCFQVPTMVMAHDAPDEIGLCLVVTPLIALMKDQVENLYQRNIRAAAIYTGMTYEQQRIALDNCQFGPYHFLYVSPERLESEAFRERLSKLPICLIAIDEAHCISQWGYDFRPSYLRIADIRNLFPQVPVLALTATATPEVVDDIQQRLGFAQPNVFRKSFHRENLHYVVRYTDNKEQQILHILSRVPGSAIIYVRNRKRAQELSARLQEQGIQADFYHAGLSPQERTDKQRRWKDYAQGSKDDGQETACANGQGSKDNGAKTPDNTIRVMVCTNAFGMGIDKPDVRLVIHHDLPDTLEAYYQEAGRAGRDGNTAFCVLLYNPTDKTKARKRIHDNFPPKDFIEDVYHKTCDYLLIALGFGADHTYSLHIDDLCRSMRLPLLQTYSAFHLLDQAGYIRFEEQREISARVMIRLAPAQLTTYSLSSPQRTFLDYLMRQCTGIFTDLQYIDEDALAPQYGGKKAFHSLLVSLAQQGIITYIPHTIASGFTPIRDRQPHIYLSASVYEDRLTRYADKLKAMVEYAEQQQFCREQILLAYFGENDAHPCSHCDVCLTLNKLNQLNTTQTQ